MNSVGGHLTVAELDRLVETGGEPGRVVADTGHLRECLRCRQAYLQLSRIDGALRHLPLPRPGVGFTNDVLRKVLGVTGSRRSYGLSASIAGVFIAMFGTGFIAVGYLLASRLLGVEAGGEGSPVVAQGVNGIVAGVRWGISVLDGIVAGFLSEQMIRAAVYALAGGAFMFVVDRLVGRVFRSRLRMER